MKIFKLVIYFICLIFSISCKNRSNLLQKNDAEVICECYKNAIQSDKLLTNLNECKEIDEDNIQNLLGKELGIYKKKRDLCLGDEFLNILKKNKK